jgi:phage terminase large subunit-like protein
MAFNNNKQLSRALKDWQDLCTRIASQTVVAQNETDTQKKTRIATMVKPTAAAFEKFCNYYFPHYITCEFAWFHKKAANNLSAAQEKIMVAEWPRGHAKSVFFNVFMPLWLLARNELTGMILVSETENKACTLLGDIQAEFTSNARLIADFGAQNSSGNWSEGKFITASGIGFWAFGLGQNPAGTRNAQNRPNYITVDDADSRKTAKNRELTKERVEWVRGELLGCVTGNKRWRMVIANNRVAKDGLLAHMVGDITESDPVSDKIIHIKAFAFEDPKTHKMLMPEYGGQPAWPQRYTFDELKKLIDAMDYRPAMRNFFHQDITDGNLFKPEHITWIKPLKPAAYTRLISYCDPSFKGSKTSDFKAIVLMGLIGNKIHILDIWCRQASVSAMIAAHYDMHDRWQRIPLHWMEAGFLQGLILDEYDATMPGFGYTLPIRPDKRSKGDKYQRIEAMSGLFERGIIQFSENLKGSPDCAVLLNQLYGFPNADHDDGPDAIEGGVWFLNQNIRIGSTETRMGQLKRNSARTG